MLTAGVNKKDRKQGREMGDAVYIQPGLRLGVGVMLFAAITDPPTSHRY